jgi:phosphoribosylanthranilate isomerase
MNVKICGLTRADDARHAHDLGAWALGFILYPPSKRYITPAALAALCQDLPQGANTTGVFVNQMADILNILQQVPFSMIQLHGDETPDDCRLLRRAFNGKIIKAFRPQTRTDVEAMADYEGCVDYFLIDAAVAGAYGGTGQVADWTLALQAKNHQTPLILSGGLQPDNIAEAAKQVQPFALDLASGVEASPGIKDIDKLQKLFTTLKDTTHAA